MNYPEFLLWCVAVSVSVLILAPGGFAQAPIKLGAIFPLADITGDKGAKAMKIAVKESIKPAGCWGARWS